MRRSRRRSTCSSLGSTTSSRTTTICWPSDRGDGLRTTGRRSHLRSRCRRFHRTPMGGGERSCPCQRGRGQVRHRESGPHPGRAGASRDRATRRRLACRRPRGRQRGRLAAVPGSVRQPVPTSTDLSGACLRVALVFAPHRPDAAGWRAWQRCPSTAPKDALKTIAHLCKRELNPN